MRMSSGYELRGRTSQKQRTRHALIDSARDLLSRGLTPTVEQAAESASVSRPTAYRYFPNQHALLRAAHPELAAESLLPEGAPEDPVDRLEMVSGAVVQLLLQHETALRAMLRLSLEEEASRREPLALRTGRRITWVQDALSPLRDRFDPQRFDRLVLQVAATLGIESFVWLVDIAHIERKEAAELLRASARELLEAAL